MAKEHVEACISACDAVIDIMRRVDDSVDRRNYVKELQQPLSLLKDLDPLQFQRIFDEVAELCGHGYKGFLKSIIEKQIRDNVKETISGFTDADLTEFPTVNGVPAFTPHVVEHVLLGARNVRLVWDTCSADPYFTEMSWDDLEPLVNIEQYNSDPLVYHPYVATNRYSLKSALNKVFPTESRFSNLDESVERVAKINKVDFYRDWLMSYDGKWDGVDRINDKDDCWPVKYFKAPKEQWSASWGRMLLISLVHRCLSPGCDLRNYFVIEGEQNIGKSKFCQRLVPSRWFTKGHINKDNEVEFYRATYDRGVVEMDEEGGLDRGSISVWKSIVTNPNAPFRRMHANDVISYPKRNIYIVTTNNWQHLNDSTGNTRCLPITSGLARNEFVDWDSFDKDYPMLLAQAIQMYKDGWRPYITADEIPEQIKQTVEREIVSEEQEWVDAYLSSSDIVDGQHVQNMELAVKHGFRVDDVIRWLSGNDRFASLPLNYTDRHKFKMGMAIKKHGFRSKSVRDGGVMIRKWIKVFERIIV